MLRSLRIQSVCKHRSIAHRTELQEDDGDISEMDRLLKGTGKDPDTDGILPNRRPSCLVIQNCVIRKVGVDVRVHFAMKAS